MTELLLQEIINTYSCSSVYALFLISQKEVEKNEHISTND